MSEKKLLGFDMDGVLYPWTRVVWDYFLPDKYKTVPFDEFWAHPTGETEKVIRMIAQNDETYNITVADSNIVAMVNRLAERFDIEYVTCRPARYNTEKWLTTYKFPCLDDIYVFQDKVPFIKGREYAYYVDDRVKIIERIKNHTQAIIVTLPWNKEYEDKGVMRIDSILDLERILP